MVVHGALCPQQFPKDSVLPVGVLFQIDSRLQGFVLHYAGAPLELTYEDTSNLDGLLNEQYIQFNLAEPAKTIGGVKTQGTTKCWQPIEFPTCLVAVV